MKTDKGIARFRSQARVIDLLGRQQIADAPTAIGELFKNALDAGARNGWVDYFESADLLVVRDDGLGMRPADVTDKWLVLATDSSHQSNESNADWMQFADAKQKKWLKEPRYGEKGIGRLSVSSLGRMVLLWSVWGEGDEKVGTLCLVHWHLFQHPGKLFEDLPIPLISLNRPAEPKDLAALLKRLRTDPVVSKLLKDESWSEDLREELRSDVEGEFLQEHVNWPLSWNVGTTFSIRGLSDQVPELFLKGRKETAPGSDNSPDWLKSLHAFSTFWDPFHKPKGRDFRIHPTVEGKALGKAHRFWSPADFERCDHHIRIEVSADGFAQGVLKNFREKPVKYQKQLKNLPPRYSTPGPFVVEIGYLQGNREISKLPDDLYRETEQRLIHAGGFSIYLNKVRVQPYGSVESDFAGFEERRSRRAGRHYFSARRMFGGIFIPSKLTTSLEEKAGREGFIVNGARRGLRLWIEDLFVDLADSYYGAKSNREDKKKLKQRKESELARVRLAKEKKDYLDNIRLSKGWLRDFERRTRESVEKARGFAASERNSSPGTFLRQCEESIECLRVLAQELRDSASDPPVGVVLEGDDATVVDLYLSERAEMLRKVDREIAKRVQESEALFHRARGEKEQIVRIRQRISDSESDLRNSVNQLLQPILKRADLMQIELRTFADKEIESIIENRNESLSELSPELVAKDPSGELYKRLEKVLQRQFSEFEEKAKPRMLRLASEVAHLTDNTSGTLVMQDLADELTRRKAREAFLIEMAQLGLITETATHEHEKHVNQVRDCINSIRKQIDGPAIKTLEHLADSFDIVDARMRMFDPLIRRNGVISDEIDGSGIEEFLRHHFSDSFIAGFVDVTEGFKKVIMRAAKKPVMLGAIYNIFHNALYWCRQGIGEPAIRLSGGGSKLVISDSGPGVTTRDKNRIFEPGFSRRPFGRGLGLFIAEQALLGTGFTLSCSHEPELGALEGANFVIVPKQTESDEQDH